MKAEIAFATCQKMPEMTDDDRLVAKALRMERVGVHSAVWDAPDVDWSRFDRVIIRSTWDYHLKPEQYARWLLGFLSAGNRLWNPPEAVLQNLNKRYLSEWGAKGINVVPTSYQEAIRGLALPEILKRLPWEEVVIKPAVSASAFGTWRTSRSTAEADQARFAELTRERDILIQPFIPEIAAQGEWSLIFFGGEYSHSILKRPAADDFRVQPHLGGSAVLAEPAPELIQQAKKVLSKVGQPLLYARVDGIVREGRFILMELEINEPVLFLGLSQGAPQRFARAILSALSVEK